MKAQTFPLPVRCPSCRAPLTALVGPSRYVAEEVSWKCPCCHTAQASDFGGLLVWIKKRLPQETPSAPSIGTTQPEDGI